jgi:hypothetical protein
MKENHNPSLHRKNILGAAYVSLCVLLLALALPLASRAQDTGYISGTVTDNSGAAVAGAEVVVSGAGANLEHNTKTNSDGAYVVAGLPGGTYDLIVTAKGFQKYQAKGVKLDVAQKIRVDVQLTVGAVTETIEVTGESVAQVQTESSEIGSTITGKQISNLMLNGRNFTQLVTLTPGVVSQTGSDEGKVGVYGNVAFSMNGGRTEYNNWELDGGDNMDNGSNATLNVYPSLESIAEFKVLTSTYGAQYGRNGSGTVEVETKSGTSSFHGSAFEYLRNDFFNAKNWSEGLTPSVKKASYKKQNYGYTVGGPVFIPNHYNSSKKKTFFFFSEEWRKESNTSSAPSSSVSTTPNVPSDAERAGNFSDLCPDPTGSFADCPHQVGSNNPFPGNTIVPTATGTALLALIPQAIPGFTVGGFPAFHQTVSTPTTWREELVRIDHNLTDKYRLTFRYIHDSWQTVVPNPLWGNGNTNFQNVTTNFVGPGSSFVARLNANISPTLLNEFVASYTADHIFLTTAGPVGLPPGFAMGSIFNNGFGGKLPAIQLQTNNAYGGSIAQDSGYFPWHNANPTYTYRDNMTKVLGTHTFQFGAYIVFAQKNEANSPNVQGILTFDTSKPVSTGNALADLLLGNVASYKQWSKETQYYDRYKIVEPYFQDDWRINKRLTLNLGMRVSLFGTYRERYRQAFNFNPSAFNGANEPTFSPADGSLAQNAANTANPLNGFVQCGGKGGTLPLVPGSLFPTVSIGSSSNAGCLKGHLFNPAPRIGFAFDPKGDGRMAIRGGYGIFYEHTNGNEANTESLEGSPPLVLAATQTNVIGYQNIGAGGGSIPFFPLTVVSIPNKAVWPYVQQWNLNIQKELPSHIVVTGAYVGSKGTHLTQFTNGNQILPFTGNNPFAKGQPLTTADCSSLAANGQLANGTPVPAGAAVNMNVACGANPDPLRTNFPGFSNIGTLRDVANSNYHSLQFSANRTVGDLTTSVAYTYSHSIDDSSDRAADAFVNAYDTKNNRASSNFDQRHNLSISYVYGLPFFRAGGFTHTVLGGWQISGITAVQSGNPFTVTNGTNFGDNAGVANGGGITTTGSRPDLAGNPRSGFSPNQDPTQTGPLAYNPAAFAIPTGLTFGDVGRNTLTLPRRVNFDFGLFKRFSIGEKTGFDFRWENFNLFNHTQFNAINAGFGPGNFLHLTNAHDSRRMQFGLRFYF